MSRFGPDAKVSAAMAFMRANMSKPLTLARIAVDVELSESRVSHLFQEQLGMSVREGLRRMRLERAARLMETADRPIKEIAHEVGFSSAQAFSRAFSEVYSVSPGEFRRARRRPA